MGVFVLGEQLKVVISNSKKSNWNVFFMIDFLFSF